MRTRQFTRMAFLSALFALLSACGPTAPAPVVPKALGAKVQCPRAPERGKPTFCFGAEGQAYVVGLQEAHGWDRGMRVLLAQPTIGGSPDRPVAIGAVVEVYTDAARLNVLYQIPDANVLGSIAKPIRSGERVRLDRYVARITEIEEGGRVRIDIGEADHVQAGDIYTVLSEGNYVPIARVRITTLDKLAAWAAVLDRYEPLRPGQDVTYQGPPSSAEMLPITILVTNFDPVDPADAEQASTGRSFAKQLADALANGAAGATLLKVRYEPGERVKLGAGDASAQADARAIGQKHGADVVVWGSMQCGKSACATPQYTVVHPERLQNRDYRGGEIWMDRDHDLFRFKGEAPKDPLALGEAILGSVAFKAERYADAVFYLSRAVSKGVLRGEDEFRGRLNLTYAFYVRGQGAAARAQANELMVRAREQGKTRWENWARGDLADLDKREGHVEAASASYRAIIDWSEAYGDSGLLGWALHQLAILEAQQGRVDKARELYERSLTLTRSIGNVQGEARTLHQLAFLEQQQGRIDKAREPYERSLTLERSIGDVQGEAATLHQLAILESQQGRDDKARELYERSLTLTRSIGNVQGEARTLHELAYLEAQQGRIDKARELYERSLTLTRSIRDVQTEAATLHELARLESRQGRVDKARELYERSLTLARSIGNVSGAIATVLNLAYLDIGSGKRTEARQSLTKALEEARSISDVDLQAWALDYLGQLEQADGNLAAARSRWTESLALYSQLKSEPDATDIREQLAVLTIQELAAEAWKAYPALLAAGGVVVADVMPDGQASAAGITPGDILLRYGTTPLDKISTLQSLAKETPPSTTITIEALRGAVKQRFQVHGGPLGAALNDLPARPVAASAAPAAKAP